MTGFSPDYLWKQEGGNQRVLLPNTGVLNVSLSRYDPLTGAKRMSE